MTDGADSTSVLDPAGLASLAGCRIALVGRLAAMTTRDARKLFQKCGGELVPLDAVEIDLVVVGEDELPLTHVQTAENSADEASPGGNLAGVLPAALCQAAEEGRLEALAETQLWQRLGLVPETANVHRLYTAAMLASLLGVSTSVIRRWQRRGLIVPVKEVRRLAYYDFQEVATARRLAELLAAGVSPAKIQKQLDSLGKILPGVQRPLAQLSIIVEGTHILLRQGDGLIDAGGQMRLNFDSPSGDWAAAPREEPQPTLALPTQPPDAPISSADMQDYAAQLEEQGLLTEAADAYRAALAAGGPDAELCFLLADVLYRTGDVSAARERYSVALEIDEDYVEARLNLGCVLLELGRGELASAAFAGALASHPEYADAEYHLARTLDELNRADEAAAHWQAFLRLAPESPWADEARDRLNQVEAVES